MHPELWAGSTPPPASPPSGTNERMPGRTRVGEPRIGARVLHTLRETRLFPASRPGRSTSQDWSWGSRPRVLDLYSRERSFAREEISYIGRDLLFGEDPTNA